MSDHAPLSEARQKLLRHYLRGRVGALSEQPISRYTGNEPIPLSYAQEQVWLHAQMAPHIALYNEPVTIHYRGTLDIDALERAFNEILRRHEAWRTCFATLDGVPVQRICPAMSVSLPVLDLRSVPEDTRESEAVRVATQDATKPLDLAQAPLFRARLIRMADEEYRLYLTLSHIIFDGVAIYRVFLPELSTLYKAFAAGEQSPLPELAIQYKDFSVWQRERLRPEVLSPHLEYWRQQLLPELPGLELPIDHPRPPVQTFRGSMYPFVLTGELKSAIKTAAHTAGVTLFQALLASFAALLSRYSGEENFSIGSVTSGRDRPETQALLGYFLNTVVLRADLSGDPTFFELMRRMRDVTIGALAHDCVPFNRLIHEFSPSPDLSRNPFFQIMFSLEPPMPEVDPAWRLTQMDVDTGASKYDLYLELDERREEILARFHYSTELFDLDTIQRMAGHWIKLIAGAAENPELRVSELPLLSEREQSRIREWNETRSDYPNDKCIHQLFAEQCRRTPDALAVIHGSESYTFQALDDASDRLANRLSKAGVLPRSRVAVCLERSPEFVVAALAIFKAGAAYVPLDPWYPADRLAFMLQDSSPGALITARNFLDKLSTPSVPVLCLDENFQEIADDSAEPLDQTMKSDDPAYVIYTSGSTGKPRGVVGSHKACVNRFSWMWREYPFADGEVCSHKTNLSFVDSIWEIFGPLLAGVPNVIIPQETVRDPEELLRSLADNRVTRIVLVPSLLRSLLDQAPNLAERVPDLKLWSCSGEVLTAELAMRFRAAHPTARLLNIYGSSEVAADVTCYEVTRVDGKSSVPIGKPISNTRIYILDRYSNPVPPGIGGEIYVGGDGVATGYWQRPELTKQRFIESPLDGAGRLFRTGDLGRWCADGNIEYLGRIDTQVKLRGMRLELGEVEAVLATHFRVREAAAALTGEGEQQRLTAYFTAVSTQAPAVAELRRYLRTKLPEHMVPADYVLLERLPLLPSGKVDRKALSEQKQKLLADEQPVLTPQTQLEKRLAEIWQELLHAEHIGLEQNFFELGGHSLMVLQMIARMRRTFAVEIPVRTVFEQPTIAQLAFEVQKELAAGKELPALVSQWKARSAAAGGESEDLLTQLDRLPQTDAQSILRRVLNEKQSA